MRAVPVGERSSAAVLQWGVLRTETESMSGQAVGRNPLDQALWNSPASDGWLPGGFAGTIQRGLDRLTYGMTALLTPARQPIPLHDAIAKAGGTSFLLIAAGRQPDETKAANYFRSAAPDRVSVWTAPGAIHPGALDTDPQQWESHVITFLNRTLGAS